MDIAGEFYDVAYSKWQGSWRMPTKEQCNELIEHCTSEWTSQNGVNGRRFTGKSGNSIFLPAAGYKWDHGLSDYNLEGHYWSSISYLGNLAYGLDFSDETITTNTDYRYVGQSVRPVRK